MCERLKQTVLKTVIPERVSGVRIPLPPPEPFSLNSRLCVKTLVAEFQRITRQEEFESSIWSGVERVTSDSRKSRKKTSRPAFITKGLSSSLLRKGENWKEFCRIFATHFDLSSSRPHSPQRRC